jgi:hypothetical protein
MRANRFLGIPAHVVCGVAHLAERLGDRLTDLQGENPGQVVTLLQHGVGQAVQDGRSVARAGKSPSTGRGRRGIEGGERLRCTAVCHRGDDLLGGRILHIESPVVGSRLPVAGEEPVRDDVQRV